MTLLHVTALSLTLAACTPRPGAAAPLALREPRASHSAALLPDGTILVAGGFRKGPDGHSQLYSDTTELIDPVRGRVVPGPALATARAGHASVELPDGSVLAIAGWSATGVLASCERFDPVQRRWISAGALHEPRSGTTATVLADGRVVVIGGGNDTRSLASIELYERGTWRAAGQLLAPRAGHTATLLDDGTILVAGGASARGVVSATAERYDPRTGRSVAAGALGAPRYKHAAARLADGSVLLIGGSDARDWRGAYATTEIFDPRTGAWRAGGPLTRARFKLPQAVAVLADGSVAIAGGAATVEVIRGGASREVADLGRASYFATATLVASELVVVGGYDERLRASTAVTQLSFAPSRIHTRMFR